jgi:hypothetical protein
MFSICTTTPPPMSLALSKLVLLQWRDRFDDANIANGSGKILYTFAREHLLSARHPSDTVGKRMRWRAVCRLKSACDLARIGLMMLHGKLGERSGVGAANGVLALAATRSATAVNGSFSTLPSPIQKAGRLTVERCQAEAWQSFAVNGGRMVSRGSNRSARKCDRDYLLSPTRGTSS